MFLSRIAAIAAAVAALGCAASSHAQTIIPANIPVVGTGSLVTTPGSAGRCTYTFSGITQADQIVFDKITRSGSDACDNLRDMRITGLTLIPQTSQVMLARIYMTSLDPIDAYALDMSVGWNNATSGATFGLTGNPHAHYAVTGGIVTITPSIYVQ
ncbi:hypothetical protein [Burkholderia alba]|uniref:hypothetical protein n=1 Tax=Burkholderia alba TaxID=2683677 RepID=UPI002B061D46|nr:hypothetical protein [Burkholderia alba]